MSPLLVSTVSIAAILASVANASHNGMCYFPKGNVAHNNVPCNPDAAVSSCCAQTSFCLANGLCLVNNDQNTVEFARGACTDQTFQDPACFQHCLSSQPGSPDSNGAAVFECGSTGFQNPANYCCENGLDAKTACCATQSLIFSLGPGTFGAMPTSPSTPAAPSQTVTVTDTETIPCTTGSGGAAMSTGGSAASTTPFVSSAIATRQPSGSATVGGGAAPSSANATIIVGSSTGPVAPVSTSGVGRTLAALGASLSVPLLAALAL